jgi:hypothetical protein
VGKSLQHGINSGAAFAYRNTCLDQSAVRRIMREYSTGARICRRKAGKLSAEPFHLMFVGLSLSVTEVPILIDRFQTRVVWPVGSVDSVL